MEVDGPHYPIRVEREHATEAKTATRYYERTDLAENGVPFDAEYEAEDAHEARRKFGVVSGDQQAAEQWRTVPLTPPEYELLATAVAGYAVEERPTGEAWEEFEQEVMDWHDRNPVRGDLGAEEYVERLELIAEQYQEWTLDHGPDAEGVDAMLSMELTTPDGSVHSSAEVVVDREQRVGNDIYRVHVLVEQGGDSVLDAQIAEHPHRHSVVREVAAFLDHAEDSGPAWLADSVEDDAEQDDAEEQTTHRIEFGGLPAANAAREEWSEWVCPLDDDERLKTVAFKSGTPEAVLDSIENKALDSRGEQTESITAELTEREREKISEVGGFDQSTTVFNWRSAKGVFAREGMADQFEDAIGNLSDYDGPEEGAEEYISDARQSDAEQGTSSVSGGAMDAGAEDVKQQERAADAARKAQDQGCDHARDLCEHGDPAACEHLQEVCGLEEDEVERLLADSRHDDTRDGEPSEQQDLVTVGGGEYPEMEVTPEAAGALRDSWSGYKSAVGDLDGILDDVREQVQHAQRAMAAINAIRRQHDQEEIEPDRLHDLLDALGGMPQSIPETRTLAHYGATPGVEATADVGGTDPIDYDAPEQNLGGRTIATREGVRRDLNRDPRLREAASEDERGIWDLQHERSQRPNPNERETFEEQMERTHGNDGGDQFAAEQQGTLDVGVESEEVAEEQQVTLTGANAEESDGAVPGAWRRDGTTWKGGPYRVAIDSHDGKEWAVRLFGDDRTYTIADGMREASRAEEVADVFTDRVAPDEVTFHSSDPVVMEAAAEAKKAAAESEGGLSAFGDSDD